MKVLLRASWLLAAILVLTAKVVPGAQSWDGFHGRMSATLAVLTGHFVTIDRRSHMAAALEERLDADAALEPLARPTWLTPGQFLDFADNASLLDTSLIVQLASGKTHAIAMIRGMDDVPVPSVVDHSWQPFAFYIPPSYDPSKPAPLVVFLHGATQSEVTVLASPWVRKAAVATGAIVAAPFARGDSQYADPAPLEVYQAVDIAERAFNVDRSRVYLAGHSMGGFGVFVVGPLHPQIWAAFLSVSGSMTEEDKSLTLDRFIGKRVYIVEGADDPVVPPTYPKRTLAWLRAAGIETAYYEQPDGQHSLGTIYPAFFKAWQDMLNGVMPAATPD
jgi:S-formylglutathione hydrolase FrmB